MSRRNMTSYTVILKKLENFCSNVFLSLPEVEELNVSCKSLLRLYLNNTALLDNSSTVKIQAVIDYMKERVNIGNWKDVKLFLRKTITIASYLKLLAHIKCSGGLSDNVIKESFKIIDIGILFGCSIDVEPMLLQNCAAILSTVSVNTVIESTTSEFTNNQLVATEKMDSFKCNMSFLETLDCPSMEYFYQNHIFNERPVVLQNCIDHWPALTKWKDQNYFIELAGLRTVSIELGRDYTDFDWTQKLMTIEEFIKNHIYSTDGPTGYLAQYQLFEQIPELKKDIVEPEYCCFADSTDSVDVMAWYGPKGTVSPIHHDPKRNLLAQVVGEKQIFLFSPKESECLYPHEHELLNNTAKIDPRQPDLHKYPKFKDAKGYYCVLKPGQMLYIPPKWWHFVESLSVSFSVSFWWE